MSISATLLFIAFFPQSLHRENANVSRATFLHLLTPEAARVTQKTHYGSAKTSLKSNQIKVSKNLHISTLKVKELLGERTPLLKDSLDKKTPCFKETLG